MNTENKYDPNENLEGNKEILEEALVSENFVVYCDSKLKRYLKPDDVERIDDIKKFVDDMLKSEQNIKKQKVKVYLFSNKDEYLKYLDQNFPDAPKDMASFDRETNSVFSCSPVDIEKYKSVLGEENLTDENIENVIRGGMFSGIGHEYSHLHSPFNGIGNNEDLASKWEQEMVCVFMEDKIRLKFDEKFNKNIKFQAKECLKKFQIDKKIFSWEEVGSNWDNFTVPERFVYFWLEEKYGLEKLQDLWNKLFKEKKTITEAVKEVYNKDIKVLENNFQIEIIEE